MALQTKLFNGTLETLTYLKSKGYQMHIITNGFTEVQHAKLRNSGLSPFFGKVFISEEIKNTKPHHEIFEHALKSTNALKKKSIMIGDSWETDIKGALDFGIDQIMFVNHGSNAMPDAIKTMRLSANSPSIQLKAQVKTWFIEEITDLNKIL
jgi:putative hydrolase of the HAD superfamily